MDAYVSGQAATAVVVDGSQCGLYRHGEGPHPVALVGERDIARIFVGCTDLQRLVDVKQDAVIKALEKSWRRDRALRLLLLCVDDNMDYLDRLEAEGALGELLDSDTGQHVLDCMSAEPLPVQALKLISEASLRACQESTARSERSSGRIV